MSTQVQFRRGTTTQNNAFTGANGEISIDTDVKTIRLHDGVTGGGAAIMLNTTTAQTALNKTFSTGSVWTGNAVALAYGGTGSSLSAVSGAVAYSGASGLGLSAAGTSGQVLVSGGTNSPVWVNASSLTTGVATTAVSATNISGGSAGQLLIQSDTSLTTFITAGAAGTFLQSAGAGYAPTWAAGQVTIGSTAVALGGTVTSYAGVTSLTMANGSYGNGTVSPTITGSGPWTATITGMSSTTGINVGQNITATAGTGTLFGGTPTSVVVASIVSGTSITVTVTGGTTPTTGTITSITTFGYLQVPTGTTAQRPYTPAVGMIRYNSTTVGFEGYSSGAWSSLGGVSSVDKYTYIQAETSAGASNGELEFFAKNSAGTAAVKVAGMNYSRFLEATGTVLGTQTTQNLFNTVATTVNFAGAATTLSIGSSTGTTTVNNNLTVAGTLTVNGTTNTVNSTNTTYADSLIELHYTNGGTLTSDDGKDIGIRMHYYKGSDKNAALLLSNDESQMEFYVNGTETSGVFSGTYGYYKAQGFNHADIFLHDSFTATTSGTSAYTVYSFPIATYRSADITVQVKNGTTYSIQKMLVIHDGTTASISANYLTDSQLQTASTGTTFSATISAGNLLVQATVPSGSSVVKGSAQLFTI